MDRIKSIVIVKIGDLNVPPETRVRTAQRGTCDASPTDIKTQAARFTPPASVAISEWSPVPWIAVISCDKLKLIDWQMPPRFLQSSNVKLLHLCMQLKSQNVSASGSQPLVVHHLQEIQRERFHLTAHVSTVLELICTPDHTDLHSEVVHSKEHPIDTKLQLNVCRETAVEHGLIQMNPNKAPQGYCSDDEDKIRTFW